MEINLNLNLLTEVILIRWLTCWNKVGNLYIVSANSINFLDSLPDDPIQRKPDLSLAQKMIKWNPITDIEKGISLTIKYFKSELG